MAKERAYQRSSLCAAARSKGAQSTQTNRTDCKSMLLTASLFAVLGLLQKGMGVLAAALRWVLSLAFLHLVMKLLISFLAALLSA